MKKKTLLEYACYSGIDKIIVEVLENYHCGRVINLFSGHCHDTIIANTTNGLFELKLSNFHDEQFDLLVIPI